MKNKLLIAAILALLGWYIPAKAQVLASYSTAPASGPAQEARTQSLKVLLDDVASSFNVSIAYKDELVENQQATVPTVKFRNPDEALRNLLKESNLQYEKAGDKFYVIFLKSQKARLPIENLKSPESRRAQPSGESVGPQNNIDALKNIEQQLINIRQKAITVSGKVTSENSEGLPGVNVLLSGTTVGTTTNAEGSYTLLIPDGRENGTLVFSFIGYTTIEIPLNGRTVIDVSLVPDVKALGEVVVVGYGTQQKRDVTGSIATIQGTDISQVPVPTLDAALQGRATGLQVSQLGGIPGSPVRIQIRGTSSIFAGTEPLLVIDGIIISQNIGGLEGGRSGGVGTNPLAAINPRDIESIEVLKDAAATAIYGSRGANGVVIVTTKNGRKGAGVTTFDYNTGVTETVNLIDYVNGPQWLEMVDAARLNNVGAGVAANAVQFMPSRDVGGVNSSLQFQNAVNTNGRFDPNTDFTRDLAEQTNTDWIDPIIRTGRMREFNVSTSNGFEKASFFVSGQYRDEEGVFVGNRLQRYSARTNLNLSPTKRLNVGVRANFTYLINNRFELGSGGNGGQLGRNNAGATGGWGQANSGAIPIMPIYNADGSYFDPLRGRNVLAGADRSNYRDDLEQSRLIGGAYLEYNVLPGLSLRGEGSLDFTSSNSIYWVSNVIRYNKFGNEGRRNINNRILTGYATYNKQLGEDHELNVVGGMEVQKSFTRRLEVDGEGLIGAQQELGEVSNAIETNQITMVGGIFGDVFFVSYFSRANYKFKNRYLLGLSYRRDGSTVFSPRNRWGDFPALSAGWLLSEEDFFTGLSSIVNLLKLRASYGRTGNANIPGGVFESSYANWPGYGSAQGFQLTRLPNPEVTWELNDQLDASVEFGLFQNRLSGSVGYYNRLTKGLLLGVPVPPNAGIGGGGDRPTIITNVGNLRNRGFEFELNTTNIRAGDFQWSTSFNLTTVKNAVVAMEDSYTALPTGTFPPAPGLIFGSTITQVGGSLGTFYMPEYAGLDGEGYQQIYVVNQDVLKETGRTIRLQNVAGADSTARATNVNVIRNRFVQEGKSGLPTWFGGITNTLSYKGLELSVLFSFQGGNYIYDGHEESTSFVGGGSNVIRAGVYGNTWTPERPDAAYPRLNWGNRDNKNVQLSNQNTRFLYKGDFLRLKTLQIAYSLPQHLVKRIGLQNVRVYANAQNLLTFTSFPGFDPEVVRLGSEADRNLTQGVIGGAPFPQVVAVNGGVSISF